jgi:hypothetical protein
LGSVAGERGTGIGLGTRFGCNSLLMIGVRPTKKGFGRRVRRENVK